MHRPHVLRVLIACLAAGLASCASPNGEALFDGESLAGWRPSEFAGGGEVRVDGGRLLLDFGSPMTGVSWTGDVPRENYELAVEAARLAGTDFFCGLTFPVGDGAATLILGGWGGALVGLSCVDGEDASGNATKSFRAFETGRVYRVHVRVTAAAVKAWVDGELLFEQPRVGHVIAIRSDVAPSLPLGIAAYNTRAAVHAVRLRRL